MNAIQLKSAFIIFLALSLLKLTIAFAAPPTKVTVTEANPNSALQGEALDVVISGSGFGHGDTVKYLVSGTNDDSQINVVAVTYNEADDTLTTTIHVEEAAAITDYDIEVQPLSGRRGKGTTLFSVQANNGGGQNNLPQISCDDLFGFTQGTCTAESTAAPCMFEENLDRRGHTMLQHCDTRAMLVVGSSQYQFLFGAGYRMNLVAPWSGDYAGITNARGAARIVDFHIVVDDAAVANGCGGLGTAQAAVYFDPDLEPKPSAPRGGVVDFTIETSNGARFCNAIEFVGSDPYITHPYKETHTLGNHIRANSYERAGIWVANINQSDIEPGNPETARVEGNVVESTTVACAVGILLENVERPTVHDNIVFAPDGTGCADHRTTGIVISDSGRNKASPLGPDYDFHLAEPASLVGNTVVTGGGSSTGIVVDSGTDAVMTNSSLTAGAGSDFGICVETGANFTEKKKPSAFTGFDPGNDFVFTADCGPALP